MRAHCRVQKTSSGAGFTLTEIMIVVSLVGLLSAMAMPYLGKARDNARLSLIYRNLRELDAAKDRWALDNRKQSGEVINDIKDLSDYLRGGKLLDVIHESYELNPIGTPPGARLPSGVTLGSYPAGSLIPAP